jgi:phosphatidylglycerol:prolipoprotein diacylglycerol transferase
MFPTILSIGPLTISSFGVFMALAFVVMIYLVWRHLREFSLSDGQIFDHVLLVVATALAGARLWFVLTHHDIFGKNILFPFMIWKFPGFSFWGGFLIGVPALYVFGKLLKLPIITLLDSYAASFPFAMLLGSVAVFLDGTVVGKETTGAIGMTIAGQVGKHHPVGLYSTLLAAIACVVVVVVLKKISLKRLPPSSLWWGMLSFIGFSQLLLAFVSRDLLYFKTVPVEYVLGTILGVSPLVPLFQLAEGPKRVKIGYHHIMTKLKREKKV